MQMFLAGSERIKVATREIIQIDTNQTNIFVKFEKDLFNLTSLRAAPFCP